MTSADASGSANRVTLTGHKWSGARWLRAGTDAGSGAQPRRGAHLVGGEPGAMTHHPGPRRGRRRRHARRVPVPHGRDRRRAARRDGRRPARLVAGVGQPLVRCLLRPCGRRRRDQRSGRCAPAWPRCRAPGARPGWPSAGRWPIAVSCLWLVTGAVRAAIGHLVDVMGEPLPGVDVLRMVTAMNYVLLGLSGMAALGTDDARCLGGPCCARVPRLVGWAGSGWAAPRWCCWRRLPSTART